MDPQQRHLMETGYGALHSADLNRVSLLDSLTGIFVGVSFLAFEEFLIHSPLGLTVFAATGSGPE